MEPMLNDDIRGQVRDVFRGMSTDVEVLFFGSDSKEKCGYCQETFQLLEEVASLSEFIHLSQFDIDRDAATAQKYGVEAVPAFVLAARDGEQITDFGIRFLGIPAGHEFSSLVNSLLLVSKRDSGLSAQTREFLKSLTKPVRLQVFVTPTCPYCPRAVVLAHQMALESRLVEAEMVEAMEFPELSNRYNVSSVPQTTINSGTVNVVGAVPENQLIQQIQAALAN